MPKRLLAQTANYLRSNALAAIALFVALGGTGYAAVSLPAGSVGPAQLNHRLIGGYVRAWATVTPSNTVLGSSGGARVRGGPAPGPLTITWPGKFPRSRRACTAVASASSGPSPSLIASYQGRGGVLVGTTDASGVLPFEISVALLC